MKRTLSLLLTVFAAASSAPAALVGYGVTGSGTLFSFDPDLTPVATTIGNLGFVPEGIDFRPPGGSTSVPVLYAIDIGPATSQLYTVDTLTGSASAIGAAFPSVVGGSYDLTGAQTFGFDFNPRTLQGDGSVRIRLVSSGGVNLRLNSNTGGVTVDTALADSSGGLVDVDAAAYLNSAVSTAAAGGATTLYVMDPTSDSLHVQNPPNSGVVNAPIGPFGVTIDANPGIAFDIYSDPSIADDSIAGDRAFAALTRTTVGGGAYLLYDVDLSTGGISGGRLVGGGLDFTGGLAVIPEPSAMALTGLAAVGLLTRRRSGKMVS